MWGQIIGAGVSFMGQRAAAKQHQESLALQRWSMERQVEMQNQQLNLQRENMSMAHAADNERRAENEYTRYQEILNRGIKARERDEEKKQIDKYRNQKAEEQRYAIDRQLKTDRAAARSRELQLREFLRNQQITKDERQEALDELAIVKEIASGERDDDKRQYLNERAKKEAEREFSTKQYLEAKNQASVERGEGLQRNDMILAQIGRMESGLQQAALGIQEVPDIATFSPTDIQGEIDSRTDEYMIDVDRAADRVASVGEADLIRTGMDASTTGSKKRAEIASQLSREYQNARNRAYDDSLNYIQGRQKISQSDAGSIADMRQRLSEVAGIEGIGLDPLLRMTDARSALTAPASYLSQVGSGVYDRRLVSGGGYRGPLAVGSGVYDKSGTIGSGLGGNATLPTAAYYQNPQTAVFGTYPQTIGTASNYLQNAGSMGSTLLNSGDRLMGYANTGATNSAKALSGASAGFGGSLKKLSNDWDFEDLSKGWNNLFGTGGNDLNSGGSNLMSDYDSSYQSSFWGSSDYA